MPLHGYFIINALTLRRRGAQYPGPFSIEGFRSGGACGRGPGVEILAAATSARIDDFFRDLTLVPGRRITHDGKPGATKEGTGDALDDVAEHPCAFGSGGSCADDWMAPRLEGTGAAAVISWLLCRSVFSRGVTN